MRGQRFSTAEEAFDAFKMHVLGDTSIRVAKVLRQSVQTYAKVYGSKMGNILKNNKAFVVD